LFLLKARFRTSKARIGEVDSGPSGKPSTPGPPGSGSIVHPHVAQTKQRKERALLLLARVARGANGGREIGVLGNQETPAEWKT